MIRKKSKFWTFILSMMPGAGHMYMGFMKQGVSFMLLFFGITFLGSWLEIGPSVLITTLVWFYAFFDCLNKMSLPEEEFYQLEDSFFFGLFEDEETVYRMKKNGKVKMIVAGGLIFVGVMILWQNFWSFLYAIFPHAWMAWISNISHQVPRVVFAIVIIYVGIRLIMGKKKELDQIDWDKEEK